MTRRVLSCLLGLLTSVVSPPARASVPAMGDPWEALDRLQPFPSAGPAGWTFLVGAAERAAVEGDLLVRLDAGGEAARGPGFRVTVQLDRASGAREARGVLVGRGPRFRAALGAGFLRWREDGSLALDGALHVIPLSGVLAGAEVRAWPGEPAWAPETTWSLHVARGTWWGGITLQSGSHRLRVAVGSAWLRGVTWFAAYRDGNPSVGITLGVGPLELRAAQTSHAVLGAVSETSLRFRTRAS